jgi:hypothetical protein
VEEKMKSILAALAGAAILGLAGSQPAAALPAAKIAPEAQTANSNTVTVQYRRHYRHYRHYRRVHPRWGYVGPRPYYAWGYPYRYYPYPYRYYGPSVGVSIGPFGFGIW